MTRGWVCSPHPGDGKVEKLSLSLEDIWVRLQEFLASDQARISLGDKSTQCGDSKRSYHFLEEARKPSNTRSKWGQFAGPSEPVCWAPISQDPSDTACLWSDKLKKPTSYTPCLCSSDDNKQTCPPHWAVVRIYELICVTCLEPCLAHSKC